MDKQFVILCKFYIFGAMMNAKVLILTLTLSLPLSLLSDPVKGKILYEEAGCAKCHSDDIFTHEDRKMTSLQKLTKQVKWCGYEHDAPWFDSEAMHVVDYLNQEFYKFPEKK